MIIDARFHEALSAFIASSSMLALAAAVFFRNPRSRLHRLFTIYCLSIVWWSGSYFLASTASSLEASLFWLRFEKIGAPFIPYLFLLIIHELLGQPMPRGWRWSWVLSAMLSATAMTPFTFVGVRRIANGMLIGTPGVGMVLLTVFFWVFVVYGLRCLWRARCLSIGLRRQQLNMVFWSSVMGYTGGGINFFHHFGIPLYPLEPIGTYLVGCYAILMAYAIFTIGILDLKIVMKKSLAYSILVILVSVMYLVVGLVTERFLQGLIGYRSLIGSLVAGLAIAIGFMPLKDAIQRGVDRLFLGKTQATLAAENERMRQELERSERLKAVGVLAAGLAHEIKNPLSSIKTFTEYLPQKYQDATFRANFQRIVSGELGKIHHIVQDLLTFAKPTPLTREPVRASQLLDETLELLNHDLLQHHVTVERRYAPDDVMMVDRERMKQVFLNLFLNSLEAMNGHGMARLTIGTERNHQELQITIADTGCGIPSEKLPHIFDPFVTDKPGGTGLGLSVVRGIIEQHGGNIEVTSAEKNGTMLRLSIPNMIQEHPSR